jgi:hypothetical protein
MDDIANNIDDLTFELKCIHQTLREFAIRFEVFLTKLEEDSNND